MKKVLPITANFLGIYFLVAIAIVVLNYLITYIKLIIFFFIDYLQTYFGSTKRLSNNKYSS